VEEFCTSEHDCLHFHSGVEGCKDSTCSGILAAGVERVPLAGSCDRNPEEDTDLDTGHHQAGNFDVTFYLWQIVEENVEEVGYIELEAIHIEVGNVVGNNLAG